MRRWDIEGRASESTELRDRLLEFGEPLPVQWWCDQSRWFRFGLPAGWTGFTERQRVDLSPSLGGGIPDAWIILDEGVELGTRGATILATRWVEREVRTASKLWEDRERLCRSRLQRLEATQSLHPRSARLGSEDGLFLKVWTDPYKYAAEATSQPDVHSELYVVHRRAMVHLGLRYVEDQYERAARAFATAIATWQWRP
jgi:hypothetical protein